MAAHWPDKVTHYFILEQEEQPDATYASLEYGSSQGGIVAFIQGENKKVATISWQSKKLDKVTKSPLASETSALSEAADAGFFISSLVQETFGMAVLPLVRCYIDNVSLTSALGTTNIVSDRRLRVDMARLREMVSEGEIEVFGVDGKLQLADPLTKRGASMLKLLENSPEKECSGDKNYSDKPVAQSVEAKNKKTEKVRKKLKSIDNIKPSSSTDFSLQHSAPISPLAAPDAINMYVKAYPNIEGKQADPSSQLTLITPTIQVDKAESDHEASEKPEVPITVEMVEHYLKLEKEIWQFEAKNIVKNLQTKQQQLDSARKSWQQLQKHYTEVELELTKERSDVQKMTQPSIRQFYQNQKEFEANFSKEQKEYLECLGKFEVAQKNLMSLMDEINQLTEEVTDLHKENQTLQGLYSQQDQFLESIFAGMYGSESEFDLEGKYDRLVERRDQIRMAKSNWERGRYLLQHVVKQTYFAMQKWRQISSEMNTMQQFSLITQARNSLLAAGQNIEHAARYVPHVKFPYCGATMMVSLHSACANIYNDARGQQSHQVAAQLHSAFYQEINWLLQWFNKVIDETISQAQQSAEEEVNSLHKLLQEERLRLIRTRLPMGEILDELILTFDNEYKLQKEEKMPLSYLSKTVTISPDDDFFKNNSGKPEDDQGQSSDSAPRELPNTPTVDEIISVYFKDREELARKQELTRAKPHHQFQAKLQTRRQRRLPQDNSDNK